MRGLSSFVSLYCNEFSKFNNTGAGMLDSIHQMALKIPYKLLFWRNCDKILPSFYATL